MRNLTNTEAQSVTGGIIVQLIKAYYATKPLFNPDGCLAPQKTESEN